MGVELLWKKSLSLSRVSCSVLNETWDALHAGSHTSTLHRNTAALSGFELFSDEQKVFKDFALGENVGICVEKWKRTSRLSSAKWLRWYMSGISFVKVPKPKLKLKWHTFVLSFPIRMQRCVFKALKRLPSRWHLSPGGPVSYKSLFPTSNKQQSFREFVFRCLYPRSVSYYNCANHHEATKEATTTSCWAAQILYRLLYLSCSSRYPSFIKEQAEKTGLI